MNARLGLLGMEIVVVCIQLDLSFLLKSSGFCRSYTHRAELSVADARISFTVSLR